MASRQFWSSIYHYQSESGGPKVTGWVNALFPYLTTERKTFIRNSKIDWNNRTQYEQDRQNLQWLRGEVPHTPDTRLKIEQLRSNIQAFNTYQTKVRGSDGGISPGAFPPGYTTAPMRWTYYGRENEMQMNAGFFGSAQNPKTFALEPVVGWCVSEGDIFLK